MDLEYYVLELLHFIERHLDVFLALFFTLVASIFTGIFTWLKTRAKKHELLAAARGGEMFDQSFVHALVLWWDETNQEWHLSVVNWGDKIAITALLANKALVDVVRSTAEGTSGLVELADKGLQKLLLFLIKSHIRGMEWLSNIMFITGGKVKRHRMVVGLLSPQFYTIKNGNGGEHRVCAASILVISKVMLEKMKDPAFAAKVVTNLSATEGDLKLMHEIAKIAERELKKPDGALSETDVELPDFGAMAEHTKDLVMKALEERGLLASKVTA